MQLLKSLIESAFLLSRLRRFVVAYVCAAVAADRRAAHYELPTTVASDCYIRTEATCEKFRQRCGIHFRLLYRFHERDMLAARAELGLGIEQIGLVADITAFLRADAFNLYIAFRHV